MEWKRQAEGVEPSLWLFLSRVPLAPTVLPCGRPFSTPWQDAWKQLSHRHPRLPGRAGSGQLAAGMFLPQPPGASVATLTG